MSKLRAPGTIAALALTLALAACGGEKTDVTRGEQEINDELKSTDARLRCPKEVDGGEGTKFDCTVTGPGGDQKVPMTLTKENGELVLDPQDQKQFKSALDAALEL